MKHTNHQWQRVAAACALSVSLAACAHITPKQHDLPPAVHTQQVHWAQLIDKSANLYRVDDRLYRSEQLTAVDVPQLANLGVRSVVNLRYFNRDADKQVLNNQPVRLINTPLLTWNITPKDIAHTLHTIRQAQADGAVLVHCYHGADRTGLIVAMYRVIYQNWSVDEAKREMQQGDFGYHSMWKNIDRLMSENGVLMVKAELDKLSNSQK